MRIEHITLNGADASGDGFFCAPGIELDAMTIDVNTFSDQIECGSPPGTRIDDRAGEGKSEKRMDLSRFRLGQGKESHLKASGTARQMAPPLRSLGGEWNWTHKFTGPADVMGPDFISEGMSTCALKHMFAVWQGYGLNEVYLLDCNQRDLVMRIAAL